MSIPMTAGASTALQAAEVRIEVGVSRRQLDVSALLVAPSGKVRSDADLIFFNAPVGPGLRHMPGTADGPDAICITLAAIPSAIEKVVITASLDPPATTFAETNPRARVIGAANDDVLAMFDPANLSGETALIVFEIYRGGGGWKLRAVGQGYADGLAGIATGFGISVDDPAETASAAVPAVPSIMPTNSANLRPNH